MPSSISAPSSAYASAVRRNATAASAVAPEAVRALPRAGRELPPRHELLDAMNQVLHRAAAGQVGDDEGTQSVLRFAHALLHDLRTLAGEAGDDTAAADGARPTGWGDLPQRLSTLATAAARPAADTLLAVAEMPDEPNPVTTATAAVHIMKVPSSRLLEAFVAMQRALGQQAESAPSDAEARHALAELARRLAGSVDAGTRTDSGAVVDLKA